MQIAIAPRLNDHFDMFIGLQQFIECPGYPAYAHLAGTDRLPVRFAIRNVLQSEDSTS
jgi:hypothetical protein